MLKTGNTPFYFETLDVKLEGDCFCPMRQLNTLRRQGIEELEKAVLNGFRRTSADVGQQDMTDTVSDLEKELITLLETCEPPFWQKHWNNWRRCGSFWNQHWKVLRWSRVFEESIWILNCSLEKKRRRKRGKSAENFRERRFRSFWHFLISAEEISMES